MGAIEEMKLELEEANARIRELKKIVAKHPAAQIGRIVKLVLFAAGGTVLVLAALGLTFGEGGSTSIQIFVGILLVAPETLGKAAATDAAKAFASSFGTTTAKAIAKRGKKNG